MRHETIPVNGSVRIETQEGRLEVFSAAEADQDSRGDAQALVLESVGANEEVVGLDQPEEEAVVGRNVQAASQGHGEAAQIQPRSSRGRARLRLAEAGIHARKAKQGVGKRADPFIAALGDARAGEQRVEVEASAGGSGTGDGGLAIVVSAGFPDDPEVVVQVAGERDGPAAHIGLLEMDV